MHVFRLLRHFLIECSWIKFEDVFLAKEQRDQTNLALYNLGFEYYSGIMNAFENFAVFGLLVCLHLVYFPIHNKLNKDAKRVTECSKIIIMVGKQLPFAYIRYLMLSYTFYLLSFGSEIGRHEYKHQYKWSLYVSISFYAIL